MRWLALPSVGSGEDWEEQVLKLDRSLESLGYELAEETVFLLFSHSAYDILQGIGQCLVARPVIGPKKGHAGPFLLKDWTAKEVWKSSVRGATLEDFLSLVVAIEQNVRSQEKQLERGFILCLKRSLGIDFSVTVEAIFPE